MTALPPALQSSRGDTFIIAEAGVNHNGDLGLAKQLIDVAADAGADAVKFQTFSAERLASKNAPKAAYQESRTTEDQSAQDMLRRLEIDEEAHRALIAHCEARGILFLSTPFDELAADLLADLGLPAFKIPSGELTNHPFLAHVAAKGRPMIVSTGMGTFAEVAATMELLEGHEVVLLHCTSCYPATMEDLNLRAMVTMREAFGCATGYSDHTLGIEVPVAAVALGAKVIEKHFTLDRSLPGPDHAASLEPAELTAMVTAIRNIERALGDGKKRPVPAEDETRRVARKSLTFARALAAGDRIGDDDLVAKRPGTGLSPSLRHLVVGHRLARAVEVGDVVTAELFD